MCNSKTDGNQLFFLVYFYLLVFTIINKAFVPFGIDLRYVVVCLGLIQLLLNMYGTKIKLIFDKNMKNIFLLYALIVIAFFHISVKVPNKAVFNNLVILNLYNLFNIIILGTSRDKINMKSTMGAIRFSIVVLGASILASLIGITIPFNDYQSVSGAGEFISDKRYCGYGTDPNYVSFMFVIYALLTCVYSTKKTEKIVQIIVTALFLWLSLSRTVIFVLPLVFCIYLFLEKVNYRDGNGILILVFLLLSVLPLIMLYAGIFSNSMSMSMRYHMWSKAFEGFFEHPIIGGGLGAARFRFFYTDNWMVQCHSTYFQLLCEHGIFALVLYFRIFYCNTVATKSNLKKICYLIYFIWSFTYETIYLPFTILFFAIFPYCLSDYDERGK